MSNRRYTIGLSSPEMADWLAQSLAGNDWYAHAQANVVEMDSHALSALAGRTDEEDGYFDGHHVWIGAAAYAVVPSSRLTFQFQP